MLETETDRNASGRCQFPILRKKARNLSPPRLRGSQPEEGAALAATMEAARLAFGWEVAERAACGACQRLDRLHAEPGTDRVRSTTDPPGTKTTYWRNRPVGDLRPLTASKIFWV